MDEKNIIHAQHAILNTKPTLPPYARVCKNVCCQKKDSLSTSRSKFRNGYSDSLGVTMADADFDALDASVAGGGFGFTV